MTYCMKNPLNFGIDPAQNAQPAAIFGFPLQTIRDILMKLCTLASSFNSIIRHQKNFNMADYSSHIFENLPLSVNIKCWLMHLDIKQILADCCGTGGGMRSTEGFLV